MISVLYTLKGIINLVLFTFIFIILMGNIQSFISASIEKVFPINRKIVVSLLYLLIVFFLSLGFYKYLPIVGNQIADLIKRMVQFYSHPPDNAFVKSVINSVKNFVDPKKFDPTSLEKINLNVLLKYVSSVGKIILQIFIALLLSLFYLLGKDHVATFTSTFKSSLWGRFFEEVEYFGRKFTNSFGKVIEVQFLIAFVNASLTTFVLWILGFPQLLGLGLMIFFLGLIPVAGVFISLIPLCIIAYSIGGGIKILYVVILIIVIHALESYVLNPKLMSVKTHIPVFYTFIVLLTSEHFFGIWGLILGIPIFIFILDVIDVDYQRKNIN